MSKVDLIMCIDKEKYLDIAIKNNILCGANTHAANRLKDKYNLQFLDFAYKKPDFEKHLDLCKSIRPKYVSAPDIFYEKELDKTLDFANELRNYSENVIIIPKCADIIERIERKFTIGFSIPTTYGGTEGIAVWDITNYDIHLLGGSPAKQLWYKQYFKNIISLDGNSYIKIARLSKQYWDVTWKTSPALDCNSLINLSIQGIKKAWGLNGEDAYIYSEQSPRTPL